MMTYLFEGFLLTLPLVFSTSIHMLIVKKNLFPRLRTPLSRELFGENKTLRGFWVLPVLTGAFFFFFPNLNFFPGPQLHTLPPFVLGWLLGFVYLVGELPNSYLKRRMGIPPGKLPTQNKLFFFLYDRLDSAIFCAFFYCLICRVSLGAAISFVLIGFALHVVLTQLLWVIKVRENRF